MGLNNHEKKRKEKKVVKSMPNAKKVRKEREMFIDVQEKAKNNEKNGYQWPCSEADGLECSEGGRWPRTEVSECARVDGVGVLGLGGLGMRASGVVVLRRGAPGSGEAVPSEWREIFSLRDLRRWDSCSRKAIRAWSSLFSFSRAMM